MMFWIDLATIIPFDTVAENLGADSTVEKNYHEIASVTQLYQDSIDQDINYNSLR